MIILNTFLTYSSFKPEPQALSWPTMREKRHGHNKLTVIVFVFYMLVHCGVVVSRKPMPVCNNIIYICCKDMYKRQE